MALVVKNLLAHAGDIRDIGLIPGSGRFPGEGNGTPLQYSCLENPHGQRSLAGSSPWDHKESDTACVGPGKSNLPFELRRKAGDCSRVTAGPIDLI